MKENVKKLLLAELSLDQYLTATELAAKLHVTSRTIRNYIQLINDEQPLIESHQRYGYRLRANPSALAADFSYTQAERVQIIIMQLIQNSNGLRSLDAAGQLFVSSATLAKDLAQARSLLSPYHLSLQHKKGYLTLRGSEENKRKLIRELLVKSAASPHFDSLQVLSISDFQIDDIKAVIIGALNEYNIFINDYSLSNLVIHTSIVLNRLLQHNTLSTSQMIALDGFNLERQVAKRIYRQLEAKFHIAFSPAETSQLAFLLITKTSTINFNDLDRDNIIRILGQNYLDLTLDLIRKVNERFYVDISDDEFILKFALHLKNVIFRIHNNYQEKNPLTRNFKQTYPLIYDIAVFISYELKKTANAALNEDEITFLAFHIGSIVDRKNQLSRKIQGLLVYQDYYDFHRATMLKLNSRFSDLLEIVEIAQPGRNIPHLDRYDLVLSTVRMHCDHDNVLVINPFLTEKDFQAVSDKISQISQTKKRQLIYDYFDDFFRAELFETEHYFSDPIQAIRYMSRQLFEQGYVPKEFCDSVIERERLAATSFDNGIAIPHAVSVCANHNCSYVLINRKPLEWGHYPVQVVILIGVNEHAQYVFKDVYTNLLNVFEDPRQTQRLISCRSFEEFMHILEDNIRP